MTHKQKVKIAKRLRTIEEISDKVGIFDSDGWIFRKGAIKRRMMKEQSPKLIDVSASQDKGDLGGYIIEKVKPVEVKVVPLFTKWQRIKNWFRKLWKSF